MFWSRIPLLYTEDAGVLFHHDGRGSVVTNLVPERAVEDFTGAEDMRFDCPDRQAQAFRNFLITLLLHVPEADHLLVFLREFCDCLVQEFGPLAADEIPIGFIRLVGEFKGIVTFFGLDGFTDRPKDRRRSGPLRQGGAAAAGRLAERRSRLDRRGARRRSRH